MFRTFLILSLAILGACRDQRAYIPMIKELAMEYKETNRNLANLDSILHDWQDSLSNSSAGLEQGRLVTGHLADDTSTTRKQVSHPADVIRQLEDEISTYLLVWEQQVRGLDSLEQDLEAGTKDPLVPERAAMCTAALNEARIKVSAWQQSVNALQRIIWPQTPTPTSVMADTATASVRSPKQSATADSTADLTVPDSLPRN